MFYRLIVKFLLIAFLSPSTSMAQSGAALSADQDYSKQMGKLNNLDEKIKTSRDEIKATIRQKKIARTQAQKKQLIHDIVQLHEQYKRRTVEYNDLYEKVKYRFPGKNQISNKKYLPLRVDSLEKIEEDIGVDVQLTKIRKKVEQKYDPLLPKEQKVKREAKQQQEDQKSKKRQRIKVEM